MRTYRIGIRMNGEPGRFDVVETNGRAIVDVYDRDGDFLCTPIPSPYGSDEFETVWGERFRITGDYYGSPDERILSRVNAYRTEDRIRVA